MRGDGEGEGLFVKASRRRANYFYPMFMFRVLSVACTGELSLLTGQFCLRVRETKCNTVVLGNSRICNRILLLLKIFSTLA